MTRATIENGLLGSELKRVVPEAMKPPGIKIGGGGPANDRLEAPKDESRKAA